MLNTLNVNLNTDLKVSRVPELGIKIKSQDINNNLFILRFTDKGKAIELDETYTVEILTKFEKSKSHRLTSATIYRDYARWEFDTSFITQDEKVTNYVYVRKAGSLVVSADANAFAFDVGLSEIDKDAGRVAEVYDENYQKYLDEFKDNVDFEEIAQAEQARKEAETLREESYEQLIDTAIIEADVVEKVDNKVTELTPKINDLTARLAQKASKNIAESAHKRIDNMVIPISQENTNIEVTDAHVSPVRNRIYDSIGERMSDAEHTLDQLIEQTVLTNVIKNGNFTDTSSWETNYDTGFSVSNNIGEFIPTQQFSEINQGELIANHMYYFRVDAKTTSQNARIGIRNGGNAQIIGDGNYHRVSLIATPTSDTNDRGFRVQEVGTSGFTPIYVKNALALDLTATFGEGAEPNEVDIEDILNNFTNGWFDGTKSIYNKDELFSEVNADITHLNDTLNTKIDAKDIFVQQSLVNGDFTNGVGTGTGYIPQNISSPIINDGILSFTATTKNGRLIVPNSISQVGHYYYVFARIKSNSNQIQLQGGRAGSFRNIKGASHSGSGDFELVSGIYRGNIETIEFRYAITDTRSFNFDEVQVDYMGIVDLTTYFSNPRQAKVYMDLIVDSVGFKTKYNITKGKDLLDLVEVTKRASSNYYHPTNVADYSGAGVINAEDITVETLYSLWDRLISEYPNLLTKTVMGKDSSGSYDIININYKPIGAKTKLLVTANIHGNGPNGDPNDSSLSLYEFIKDILNNNMSNNALEYLRYNVEIDFIPCGNPWGYDNKTRENYNDVDLNRDFDSALPQAETELIKNWLLENADADLYCDNHAKGAGTTAYTLTGFSVGTDNSEYKVVREVSDYVANSQECNYDYYDEQLISKTIVYAKNVVGIPALLLEFPVYAESRNTHGKEMMTNYVEWLGNVLYRYAVYSSSNQK